MDQATAREHLAFVDQASADMTGPGAKEARRQLDTRYGDALAALQWFVNNDSSDEALRLANALYRYWITSRRFEEGARWFERVLEADAGDEHLRGRAFLRAGFMPFWLGDDERAAFLFGRALEIGRRLDEPQLVSQALGGLARVALRTDVAEGRRLAHEALTVSQTAADEAGISNALHLLGVGAQMAGDLLEARQWMSRRLALAREAGNEFLLASEASNLSMVERQLGNLSGAEALAREALRVCDRIGDDFTKPFAISGLASVALERQDHERAAVLVGAIEAMMDAQSMEWPPDERPQYERLLRELPDSMGSARFEQARASGRSLSTIEAVGLALTERQPPAT